MQAYVSRGNGGPFYITDGSLDAESFPEGPQLSAVTPEPPSLLLLGTGIIALAAVLARLNSTKA